MEKEAHKGSSISGVIFHFFGHNRAHYLLSFGTRGVVVGLHELARLRDTKGALYNSQHTARNQHKKQHPLRWVAVTHLTPDVKWQSLQMSTSVSLAPLLLLCIHSFCVVWTGYLSPCELSYGLCFIWKQSTSRPETLQVITAPSLIKAHVSL